MFFTQIYNLKVQTFIYMYMFNIIYLFCLTYTFNNKIITNALKCRTLAKKMLL